MICVYTVAPYKGGLQGGRIKRIFYTKCEYFLGFELDYKRIKASLACELVATGALCG